MDDAMLKALCGDTDSSVPIAPLLSPEDQYKYMARNINSLPYLIRKKVCNIIIHNNQKQALSDCNDGVAISMKDVPDEVIQQMYDLTYFELNRL